MLACLRAFSSVPKAGRNQSLLLLTHFDEYDEIELEEIHLKALNDLYNSSFSTMRGQI